VVKVLLQASENLLEHPKPDVVGVLDHLQALPVEIFADNRALLPLDQDRKIKIVDRVPVHQDLGSCESGVQ